MSKTYNLFISHSWSYRDEYEKLESLLKNRQYFYFKNFSVPKDNPVHTKGTDKELYEAIKQKIRLCHVVLIMGGVYSSYSKWINKEIEIANKYKKPIVAIYPRGQKNMSTNVSENADKIVGWNTESIVEAIRELSKTKKRLL